jgi:hypothetical protein
VLGELTSLMSRRIQHALDATVPHTGARWGATAGLALLYALRVWALGGFYIVTYGLGIYLLNLFIGFITPQVRARGARGRVRQQEGGRVEEERGWWLGAPNASQSLSRLCCSQIDPETEGPLLPRSGTEEYRPYVGRLPEFKFWCGRARARRRALSRSLLRACPG